MPAASPIDHPTVMRRLVGLVGAEWVECPDLVCDDIVFGDGTVVQVGLNAHAGMIDGSGRTIEFHEIEATPEHTGQGTRIVHALRQVADEMEATLVVGPCTAWGYWSRPEFNWLAQVDETYDGDPVLQYR